jgi:predicted TIM-barrel fold metal-dependent hydrolase
LAVAEDLMGHLPQDAVDKICRGNAQRMLGLA